MAVVATHTLNNNFRVEVNDTGTITLQEFRSSSWQTPSGGPYSQNVMQQLWQDLAAVGFGPR